MTIESAYVGEDVPLTVTFDKGNTDPDADPTITVTNNTDDVEAVSAQTMTSQSTGVYEYVWDTTGEPATGYVVAVTAEFGGETKIAKSYIELE